jgi:peptide/nickel transport system substrate-binding protein
VRKENYKLALQRIADEAFWAPMFSYNTNYVFTKQVAYEPTADEVLRFVDMSWN